MNIVFTGKLADWWVMQDIFRKNVWNQFSWTIQLYWEKRKGKQFIFASAFLSTVSLAKVQLWGISTTPDLTRQSPRKAEPLLIRWSDLGLGTMVASSGVNMTVAMLKPSPCPPEEGEMIHDDKRQLCQGACAETEPVPPIPGYRSAQGLDRERSCFRNGRERSKKMEKEELSRAECQFTHL